MMLAILVLASTLTNVTGWVTFAREEVPFYFVADESGNRNWRIAKPASAPSATVGDRIRATGTREATIKNRLATKGLAILAHDRDAMPPPRDINMRELFESILPYGNSLMYGSLLRTRGILRDINRRQLTTQLLIGEGEHNLQVEMPWALEEALPKTLVQGALVRVTGNLAYTSIENLDEGIFGRIEDIELLPSSGADIEVIRDAPFWTSARLAHVLCALLAICIFALAWAVTLRRVVAHRTRELGESIRLRETERIEADAARRERLRLAADLHDGFQQYLAGAMFRLRAAMNYLPKDARESRTQLENVKDALQHTQNGLRSTLWAMNEESEGPESLLALFNFTARRMPHWENRVSIAYAGDEQKIARRSAGTLLLIMQEAVGNALRHGSAQNIRVRLNFREKDLEMTVIDDGRGFCAETATSAGHYGLSSMERRAAELGGAMTVWSKPRIGTKLTFVIPYA